MLASSKDINYNEKSIHRKGHENRMSTITTSNNEKKTQPNNLDKKEKPPVMKYSTVAANSNSNSNNNDKQTSGNNSGKSSGGWKTVNNKSNTSNTSNANNKTDSAAQPFDPIKKAAPRVTNFQNPSVTGQAVAPAVAPDTPAAQAPKTQPQKPPTLSYAAKAKNNTSNTTPKPTGTPVQQPQPQSAGQSIKFGTFDESSLSKPPSMDSNPKSSNNVQISEKPPASSKAMNEKKPVLAAPVPAPVVNVGVVVPDLASKFDIKRMQTAPPVMEEQPVVAINPPPAMRQSGINPSQPQSFRPPYPVNAGRGAMVPPPYNMSSADYRPRPPFPGASPAGPVSMGYYPPGGQPQVQPYVMRPPPPQGYATAYYPPNAYVPVPVGPGGVGIVANAGVTAPTTNFIRPTRKAITIIDPSTGKKIDFSSKTGDQKDESSGKQSSEKDSDTNGQKLEAKSDVKPEVKEDAKSKVKVEVKEDAKSDAKVEVKSQIKTAEKIASSPKKSVIEPVVAEQPNNGSPSLKKVDPELEASKERSVSPIKPKERSVSPSKPKERSVSPKRVNSPAIKANVDSVVEKFNVIESDSKPSDAAKSLPKNTEIAVKAAEPVKSPIITATSEVKPPPGLSITTNRNKSEKEDGEISDDEGAKIIRSCLSPSDFVSQTLKYPESIPVPVINSAGKFYYCKEFLMAVGAICKRKPDDVVLDGIFSELDVTSPTFKAIHSNVRSDSARNSGRHGNDRTGSGRGPQGKDSHHHQQQHNQQSQNSQQQPPYGAGHSGRYNMDGRSSSGRHGGGQHLQQQGRTRSGHQGRVNSQRSSGHGGRGRRGNNGDYGNVPMEKIEKLVRSANAWVRPSPQQLDELEQIGRKVRGILNKLTLERFDSLSNQILNIGITNTEILKEVISIVFDKATDEPSFSSVYAKLCAKLSNELDPAKIEIINDPEMQVAADRGVHPFRRLLLNKCQNVFEKRETWTTAGEDGVEAAASAPAAISAEDEDYEKIKLKRRVLGNVRFIGELFKLGMLGEKIMHRCILMLLKVEKPVEEEIESLCNLLTTIGNNLDHKEAASHMNEYFKRLQSLADSPLLPSRIQFMVLDVIDLRARKWKPRREASGPKTIEEIHKEAARQQQQYHSDSRSGSSRYDDKRGMGRSGSGVSSGLRGGASGSSNNKNDRDRSNNNSSGRQGVKGGRGSTFATNNQSRSSSQRGGVRGSGNSSMVRDEADQSLQTEKSASQRGSPAETPSMSRSNSSVNMFGALAAATHDADATISASPTDNAPMTPASLERKFVSIINEFMHVKDLDEGSLCISELRQSQKDIKLDTFVTLLVNTVLEKKEKDVECAMSLLKRIFEDKLIESSEILSGLKEAFEFIEDIAIDVPSVYDFVGIIGGSVISMGAFGKLEELFSGCLAGLLGSKSMKPPILKVIPNVFLTIKKTKGVSFVQEFYKKASTEAYLQNLMVKDQKTNQGLGSFLESKSLGFLLATQVSDEETVEEFVTKGDFVACLEWFRQKSQQPSEALLRHLFSTICKSIYTKCFENHKEVNEKTVKAMVFECSKLLRELLEDKPEAQMQLLVSLSDFWKSSLFELRDEYLKSLFSYFYDEDVVPEDIYFKWKERYESKPVFRIVRKWLDWLMAAEEEEDGGIVAGEEDGSDDF